MKNGETKICPHCGEITEHNLPQVMDSQLLYFCEKCKKYYLEDLVPPKAEITIVLSGARATGKTRLIAYLATVFKERGAEVDLQSVPDISGYLYGKDIKRSLQEHNRNPLMLDRMKIKFVERVPMGATPAEAMKNLRIFRKA